MKVPHPQLALISKILEILPTHAYYEIVPRQHVLRHRSWPGRQVLLSSVLLTERNDSNRMTTSDEGLTAY